MSKKLILGTACLLSICLLSFSTGFCGDIHVPTDYPTIQQAMDAALDGDTVSVAPGTYFENIDFKGKKITVRSDEGPHGTVIDGTESGSVVTFKTFETLESVLDGFTLTCGKSTWGGGIFCSEASPTLANNHIHHNVAYTEPSGHGGGVYCKYGSPVIRGNTISANLSFLGGGIYCAGDAPQILDNIISGNISHGSGGGVICTFDSSPLVKNNLITGNQSNNRGGGICCAKSDAVIVDNMIMDNECGSYGGGILVDQSSPVFTGNRVVNNKAGWIGGGLSCLNLSDFDITNSTFYGNTAEIRGGGISIYGEGVFTMKNTILWENSALYVPELWIGIMGESSTVNMNHCNLKGGLASVHVQADSTLNWGAGMIDSDPMFADPASNDFHLLYTSPCRDTGDNAAPGLPGHDFEGDPRIAYGTVDMGADEFYPHLYYIGEAAPSAVIEAKLVGLPGASINAIILGLNVFDPPLQSDYGFWYVDDPSQIITGLGTIPAIGLAVFPGTLPGTPAGPYSVYLQAALDFELTNLSEIKVK